jgi:hypothetical protein
VNFTREPILETIITPREGYKLLIRSSKGVVQEEYSVDALEVVSFGPAIFYRSLERPKPFLVPVGDFEVVEVKETRVILKNVNLERAIKIGGGREAPIKAPSREAPEKVSHPAVAEGGAAAEPHPEGRMDKKRDRHRRRRRRENEDRRSELKEMKPSEEQTAPVEEREKPLEPVLEGGGAHDETRVSSSTFGSLIPPPTTLISLSRYKDQVIIEDNVLPPQIIEPLEKEPEGEKLPRTFDEKHKKDEEENSGSEISDLYRVNSTYTNPSVNQFSPFPPDNYFMS